MSIDEMREELEQYYEAAGFANVNEKVLKEKSDEEIVELYNMTFKEGVERYFPNSNLGNKE